MRINLRTHMMHNATIGVGSAAVVLTPKEKRTFNGIKNILTTTGKEHRFHTLTECMMAQDTQALIGLEFLAQEGLGKRTGEFGSIVLSDAGGLNHVQQFNFMMETVQGYQREMRELAKQTSKFNANERARAIAAEHGLFVKYQNASPKEVKEKTRKLLAMNFTDADYDRMRMYLEPDVLPPPNDEVEEFARMVLSMAESRFRKGTMLDAATALCGKTNDDGSKEPGVFDLYRQSIKLPDYIDPSSQASIAENLPRLVAEYPRCITPTNNSSYNAMQH